MVQIWDHEVKLDAEVSLLRAKLAGSESQVSALESSLEKEKKENEDKLVKLETMASEGMIAARA